MIRAEPIIEIDHVTFGYDASRSILNDVSLIFERGKVTAILGGSGCGKTTLLRLIGGVYPANAGTVRFDGEVVDATDKEALFRLRRRLGMLFEFGALFTDLSVFENVAFPLREHTDLDEAMIRDIVLLKLNAVGCGCRPVADLCDFRGHGASRRAARAIALDPELIMYDEPFAGLDPISMGVAANLIRTLNDTTDATSLVVSHDVEECFSICDYAYLMSSQGRVVAHGPPQELSAQMIRRCGSSSEASPMARSGFTIPPVHWPRTSAFVHEAMGSRITSDMPVDAWSR